jgi:response regulator RpfG family c-di-GMP phosphodiesterase
MHHHEQWEWSPAIRIKLASEQIPLASPGLCAVADAYDAMTSDRPYRKGMPEEKVHEVFRRGAGKQWDPSVIEAFFTAREDILAICSSERANLSLDVEQWT